MNASSPKVSAAALRIRESRAELTQLLIDEPNAERRAGDVFPRSKTVRLLTSSRGATILAIAAGGLLALKPGLIGSVMRVIPVGAVLRTFALRFFRVV